MAGSLVTVSKELSKYTLDSVGVKEVRWEGGGTEPAGKYTFFNAKRNENHELGKVFFFMHKRFISVVKRAEFVTNRMSYTTLKRSLVSYHCPDRSCPNRQ
jgi:hypothetical protein